MPIEATKKLAKVAIQKAEDFWVIKIRRRPWLRNLSIGILVSFPIAWFFGFIYMYQYTGWPYALVDDKGNPLNFSAKCSSFVTGSIIYADDEKVDDNHIEDEDQIIGRFFEQVRNPLKLEDIPVLLQKGLIAAEDKRFYRHWGVDWYSTVSAFIGNQLRDKGITIWNREPGGASGLAQQEARTCFANEVKAFAVRERSYERKIKEARVAIQLIKAKSKEKVLEDFMNTMWLGHGVHGVSEATRLYFGKPLKKDNLNPAEVAILVAMNKGPEKYCPIFHRPPEPKIEKGMPPEKIRALQEEYKAAFLKEGVRLATARGRYNYVLKSMLGNGAITQDEYETSLFKKDAPPETEPLNIQPVKNPTYAYGNRMIKELLFYQGFTDDDLVKSKGLKIYTPINSRIQEIASREFQKHLALLNRGKTPDAKLDGAFVILEVKTGNILAMSGGHDFNETEYNRVMAPRSPGSAFKPFTYIDAFENHNKSFFDSLCNSPITRKGATSGSRWIPKNFKEDTPVPPGCGNYLATGLIRSNNLMTLNLAIADGGPRPVVEIANRMGVHGNPGLIRDSRGEIWFKRPRYQIRGGLVPLLPTILGASEVNLLELANAYAVLARGGIYMRPTLIKEIRGPYGEKINKTEPSYQKRVISQETADKMVALLRAVTKIGTAKISMRGIEQQVAVKTGTSDGPRDLSMIGFTPEIVMFIRIGRDDYGTIELPEYMKMVSGRADMQVSGGWVVGPLFRKIIDLIYQGRVKVEFSENIEKYHKELLSRLGG